MSSVNETAVCVVYFLLYIINIVYYICTLLFFNKYSFIVGRNSCSAPILSIVLSLLSQHGEGWSEGSRAADWPGAVGMIQAARQWERWG